MILEGQLIFYTNPKIAFILQYLAIVFKYMYRSQCNAM